MEFGIARDMGLEKEMAQAVRSNRNRWQVDMFGDLPGT